MLTDRLIRLEWSENEHFEDRATLAVCNRRFPVPAFETRIDEDTFTLNTSALTLTWRDTGRPFSASNLSVVFHHREGEVREWKPGRRDKGNLGGTCRTLDGADGERFIWWQNPEGHWLPNQNKPVERGWGVLSREGWSVHDDTGSVVLDPGAGRGAPWVAARPPGKHLDWYLFAHGLDFRAALRDAARLFGPQPLPPKFVFGYWYSRYWAYTDRDLEDLADKMDELNLPVDVLVIDMDWHLPGWTGYTWDRRYIPDPGDLLARLHQRGLKIPLNLHPADGIGKHEEAFPEACRALGLDPKKTDRIPFDCTDPAFIKVYFEKLHHPHEDLGVDFWWLDWQQGAKTKLDGLDPLPWLNHLHWIDLATRRPRRRPLCFSRFGGPGAGRYPVGFSGDTYSTWASLAFQPGFTARAANILYGYWSHDIGGHQPGPVEPELYTRWVQFGVYSPILRSHSGKNRASDRRVWRFPEPHCDIMMDAIRLRYRIAPYIYTECRKAADTGVSLVRPLYIDHPEETAAYRAGGQYGFGDVQMVAPVTEPVDRAGLAKRSIWLPPGRWYDHATGTLDEGGRHIRRSYLLQEIPVFTVAGTPLPGQLGARRLDEGGARHLLVEAVPGGDGDYRLYEDDGQSTGYLRGECVWIPLRHTTRARGRSVRIGPAAGSYRGFRTARALTVRFEGMAPATRVRVGGAELPRKPAGAPGDGWHYDGDAGAVVVELRRIRLDAAVTVTAAADHALPDGWKGLMTRLREIGHLANLVSPAHPLHPDERLAIEVGQTGHRISRDPGSFRDECQRLKRNLRKLPRALEAFQAVYASHGHDHEQVAILQKARDLLDDARRAYRL